MSWKTDEIYPSRDRIAKQIGHSIESVKRAIKFLEDHGFITVGKRLPQRSKLTSIPWLAFRKQWKLSAIRGSKNESGPAVGNKAQSVKPSNSPAESTPENTHDARPVGIDDDSAEPEQPAQPSQLPPVIVEEQPAQPAEEEEEEPDFNAYAAMAAPVALSGWVTTHNATVELKAAYEAHRNTYGESHSTPSYAHHTPSYSTAEHDAGEAF